MPGGSLKPGEALRHVLTLTPQAEPGVPGHPQAPFVFLVWVLMGQAAGEEGDDTLPARPRALSRAGLSPDGLPDYHASWLGL